MSFRIITDSASDISQEKAAAWDITVLPLKIRFGDTEYLDGVNLSNKEFFEKLVESDTIPKTSQIPPFEYEEAYKAAEAAGEEVLCLCLSSNVSGCYQSACIAAEDHPGVTVIDTRQFCISELIIVEYAVECRRKGLGCAETADAVRGVLDRAHVIAMFDTLEYLKLGGRLSSASAFAGTILSLKPVLTIDKGIVRVIGKARGSRSGNNLLRESVEKLGGIDFAKPVCLGYTGFSDELLRKYVKDSANLYEGHEDQLKIVSVGACIGTYAGPGAIAFAFFTK